MSLSFFLVIPLFGWVMYFLTKLTLGFVIGAFLAPFKIYVALRGLNEGKRTPEDQNEHGAGGFAPMPATEPLYEDSSRATEPSFSAVPEITVTPGPSVGLVPLLSGPSSQQSLREPAETLGGNRRRILIVPVVGIMLLGVVTYRFVRPRSDAQPVSSQTAEVTKVQATPSPNTPPQRLALEQRARRNRVLPSDNRLGEESGRRAAERLRLERTQEEVSERDRQRQQEQEALRQEELESQRQALKDLAVKYEEQQRQIQDVRRRLAEEQASRERDGQVHHEAETPAMPTSHAALPTLVARSEGDLFWMGSLKKNQIIVIDATGASSGTIEGSDLPGTPVEIESFSRAVEVVEQPRPENGWKRFSFRATRDVRQSVTINFRWAAK